MSSIKEIIRDEIQKCSLEYLRNLKRKKTPSSHKKKKKTDYDRIKEKEELDNVLFHGGEDPHKGKGRKKKLSESGDGNVASIRRSEIDNFVQKFSDFVTPNVIFNKDKEGNVKFHLYKGKSGVEAKVGGYIPLQGENKISFEFSIQNGPSVDVNTELTDEVSELVNKLHNFYEKWKDEWVKKISHS